MKKINKDILVFVIVGIFLVLLLGKYFGLFSIVGYNDYFEGALSYSGATRYSGYGYSEGYIVTGEVGTNCGGRQDNSGVTMYHTCTIDTQALGLMPYKICVDKDIEKLGGLKLQITGTKECVNMAGSSYNCFGWMNFYDDKLNNIGTLDLAMRLYSDGWRGTDQINSELELDLANSYENISSQKCFNIYATSLNKPNGAVGNALNEIKFNYNLNSVKVYYDAVEYIQVYRKSGEICNLVTIKKADITNNDYLTLENCQSASENINDNETEGEISTNEENYMIEIVLGGVAFILLIGASIWLIKRR